SIENPNIEYENNQYYIFVDKRNATNIPSKYDIKFKYSQTKFFEEVNIYNNASCEFVVLYYDHKYRDDYELDMTADGTKNIFLHEDHIYYDKIFIYKKLNKNDK